MVFETRGLFFRPGKTKFIPKSRNIMSVDPRVQTKNLFDFEKLPVDLHRDLHLETRADFKSWFEKSM